MAVEVAVAASVEAVVVVADVAAGLAVTMPHWAAAVGGKAVSVFRQAHPTLPPVASERASGVMG